MRKTKIICTVGPSSQTEEVLSKLIEAGMNASRHNFSHGDHAEQGMRMDLIKKLRAKHNKTIAIMLDTKGPEIRTGKFEGGAVELKEGTPFTVYCGEEVLGNSTMCSVSYQDLYKDVKIGDSILIADGLVGLRVNSIEGTHIYCTVKNSGPLGNNKNVNVPGVITTLPAVTEKDEADLKFGIEQGVDIVAASFIRKAADVLQVRKVLQENGGGDILIFSKIENHEGVHNIDEIIKFSDGIMVARGDLGVEIPTEDVPVVQKMIIEKCNAAGKPVITATQMLDSMIKNPRPTRAEASDVANAIFDGTDAIMLSGETANGNYPVETVETMSKIAERAEKAINYEEKLKKRRRTHIPNVPNAISLATCNTAMDLNAAAIITATQSGHTAKIVSNYRPECPIIAVTPYWSVARKLALNWGVFPIVAEKVESTDALIDKSVDIARETGYVKNGDLVVIAAGIPANYVGTTNMMKVHVVGDILVQGKPSGSKHGFGMANVVKSMKEAEENIQEGDILVVKELDKSCLNILDRLSGIITEQSNVDSDITILSMVKEIPLIYDAAGVTDILKTGCFITMDVRRGIVYGGKVNLV
jgi:pyruvate kinase